MEERFGSTLIGFLPQGGSVRSENIADWLLRHCILLAIMVLMVPSNSLNAAEVTPDQRLRNAHSSFHEMMAAPDKGIPLDLFNKAEDLYLVGGGTRGDLERRPPFGSKVVATACKSVAHRLTSSC